MSAALLAGGRPLPAARPTSHSVCRRAGGCAAGSGVTDHDSQLTMDEVFA